VDMTLAMVRNIAREFEQFSDDTVLVGMEHEYTYSGGIKFVVVANEGGQRHEYLVNDHGVLRIA